MSLTNRTEAFLEWFRQAWQRAMEHKQEAVERQDFDGATAIREDLAQSLRLLVDFIVPREAERKRQQKQFEQDKRDGLKRLNEGAK